MGLCRKALETSDVTKKAAAKKAAKKPKAKPGAKSKGGRPSKYTPALIEKIASRLSAGEPMARICRDEGMPAYRTVKDWMDTKTDVSALIARAREEGFDAIALDALDISDDGRRDYEANEDGSVAVNHDHIQRAKLRVDTRLKLLAKWDPKRYGDKVALEHAGPNGGAIPVARVDAKQLSDATLQELLNARRTATDGG